MAAKGLGTPVTQVSCNDCGATVNVTPGEQTAKCAFCGSQQVLAREAAGTAIRPESMVPFKVDKPAANKKFEEWLGHLWFRPNDLKRMAKLQEMGGVYIPFWTFDAWCRSDWTAEAGYYYYETEYYTDEQGNRAVAAGAAHALGVLLRLAAGLLRRHPGLRLQGPAAGARRQVPDLRHAAAHAVPARSSSPGGGPSRTPSS